MSETKAKRSKRRYDEEFRRNAVALVESSPGRSLQEIAAELGVTHWNLRDWTRKHSGNRVVPAATAEEMQREMARLRRENQSLEARCEVLKKALGILAEPKRSASCE